MTTEQVANAIKRRFKALPIVVAPRTWNNELVDPLGAQLFVSVLRACATPRPWTPMLENVLGPEIPISQLPFHVVLCHKSGR